MLSARSDRVLLDREGSRTGIGGSSPLFGRRWRIASISSRSGREPRRAQTGPPIFCTQESWVASFVFECQVRLAEVDCEAIDLGRCQGIGELAHRYLRGEEPYHKLLSRRGLSWPYP